MFVVTAAVTFSARSAVSQDIPNTRVMPGSEAPAGPYILYWGPISQAAPQGKPENEWRYRQHDGRWWYWTADENWSYFNGDIWVPYSSERDRELSRAPVLGPIAGPSAGHGVWVRGPMAGLTLVPGDHPGAPHLKRGTVLPQYLKQQDLPREEE
jgi:hypothetical protein